MTNTVYYHYTDTSSQGTAGAKLVEQLPSGFKRDEDSYLIDVVRPYFRKYSTAELINEIFEYEKKYGMKSSKVYSMYQSNFFNRESKDFLNWAILYKKFFVK